MDYGVNTDNGGLVNGAPTSPEYHRSEAKLRLALQLELHYEGCAETY